jgi:hypothetical protein
MVEKKGEHRGDGGREGRVEGREGGETQTFQLGI